MSDDLIIGCIIGFLFCLIGLILAEIGDKKEAKRKQFENNKTR